MTGGTVITERLDLVPVGPEHVEDLVRIHGDPRVAYWFAGSWTPERASVWARRQQESWRVDGTGRWLAYRRAGGELVGRGGPIWIEIAGQRVLDLGWAVRDAQTGRRYGTEIARASATYAFDVLGAAEAYAYTEQDNLASRAVMARIGMVEVGVLDEPALLTDIPLDRELAPFVQYRLDPDGFRVSRHSAGA